MINEKSQSEDVAHTVMGVSVSTESETQDITELQMSSVMAELQTQDEPPMLIDLVHAPKSQLYHTLNTIGPTAIFLDDELDTRARRRLVTSPRIRRSQMTSPRARQSLATSSLSVGSSDSDEQINFVLSPILDNLPSCELLGDKESARPRMVNENDIIPPKNWLNDEGEREVFAIFLCMALNIDRPKEFSSGMHPKTMIDNAVWIRPNCPIERTRTVAIDFIMSKIPGLYGLDSADVVTRRTAARNFRDFLRAIIDLDKNTHPERVDNVALCKGTGCINDKFRQNSGDIPNLPCADCVHLELRKITGVSDGSLRHLFEGNGGYRNLKCVLESEIRGENLSFEEIQRNILRKEKILPMHKHLHKMFMPCNRPPASGIDPIPESKSEEVSEYELEPRLVEVAEVVSTKSQEMPELEPAIKQVATTLTQLLPVPTKKVTISIAYES